MRRRVTALACRIDILLHHRPAVFVPHDLLVAHRVALPDRALRKIDALGVALALGALLLRRVVGLALVMTGVTTGRTVMRLGVVG